MLAYVTNSPSTLNLGAEEIIYMNDLGVPAAVVPAMIQQDQALKAAGEAAMAASVEANTPQPPPATAQPQPADVAPQATLPDLRRGNSSSTSGERGDHAGFL